MIQTFLSQKLRNPDTYRVMEEIFRKIAEGAFHRGGIITANYGESPQVNTVLDSVDSYLAFLMAEDFDRYHFSRDTGFWFELKNVSGNSHLKTLLSPRNPRGSILSFREKYPLHQYSKEYEILRQYMHDEKTSLSDFRKEITRGSVLYPLDAVSRAFDYSQLGTDERNTILNAMEVPVCPYCNMNYTLQYNRDGSLHNTADIDHFYTKSTYPQYSLCLYNMIPACPVCNSRLKGSHEMTRGSHLYPHKESFGNFARFRITNLDEYLSGQDQSTTLSIALADGGPEKLYSRINNSAELFHLEDLYSNVHAQTEELIEKAEIYNDGYSQELENEFKEVFQDKSIREMVFGPEETEQQYARHSLGKLRMDLLYQMGIYK